MSNVIHWTLQIDVTEEQYKKLVTFLGESMVYEFEAEPMAAMESMLCSRVTVTCSWTNNLRKLSKWIDKNIPDEIL